MQIKVVTKKVGDATGERLREASRDKLNRILTQGIYSTDLYFEYSQEEHKTNTPLIKAGFITFKRFGSEIVLFATNVKSELPSLISEQQQLSGIEAQDVKRLNFKPIKGKKIAKEVKQPEIKPNDISNSQIVIDRNYINVLPTIENLTNLDKQAVKVLKHIAKASKWDERAFVDDLDISKGQLATSIKKLKRAGFVIRRLVLTEDSYVPVYFIATAPHLVSITLEVVASQLGLAIFTNTDEILDANISIKPISLKERQEIKDQAKEELVKIIDSLEMEVKQPKQPKQPKPIETPEEDKEFFQECNKALSKSKAKKFIQPIEIKSEVVDDNFQTDQEQYAQAVKETQKELDVLLDRRRALEEYDRLVPSHDQFLVTHKMNKAGLSHKEKDDARIMAVKMAKGKAVAPIVSSEEACSNAKPINPPTFPDFQ